MRSLKLFIEHFSIQVMLRGRHLKFSMANWKNRRPSFDLLRKVIQGRPFLRWLLAPRKGRPKREMGARVLGTWRNRHPGSVRIPVEFPRFHSSSWALPTRSFQIKSDCQSNSHPNSHPSDQRWNCGGTGLELGWNCDSTSLELSWNHRGTA